MGVSDPLQERFEAAEAERKRLGLKLRDNSSEILPRKGRICLRCKIGVTKDELVGPMNIPMPFGMPDAFGKVCTACAAEIKLGADPIYTLE